MSDSGIYEYQALCFVFTSHVLRDSWGFLVNQQYFCCRGFVSLCHLQRKKQFKQAFAVVAFAGENSDDESVEAVPISWLTPQKRHCYWPPVTQPSKLKKAISSAVEPMPDWEKHDARCLKKCRKYNIICVNIVVQNV